MVSRHSAVTSETMKARRKKIEIAQERLFQYVKDGGNLGLLWWRKCRKVALLEVTNATPDETPEPSTLCVEPWKEQQLFGSEGRAQTEYLEPFRSYCCKQLLQLRFEISQSGGKERRYARVRGSIV